MGKRKLWGVMLIVTALVIMQLPVSEADAAASASDFQMNGSTLVRYVGKEKAVTLPSTVTTIGRGAFEDNDTIQSIAIPESVTKIEEYAFWGCDRLQSVTLGKGLTEVGDYVFANCTGLTSMTIPANIHSIGIYAFEDCVNLTDITIPPQVIRIHETSFDGCFKLVIHAEDGSYAARYAVDFAARQAEMPEYEDVPAYTLDTETVIIIPEDDPVIPSDSSDTTGAVGGVTVPWEEGNLLGSTRIVGNRAVVFIDNTSPTVLDSTRLPEMTKPEPELEEPEPRTVAQGVLPKYTIVDGSVVADQAYYRSNALRDVQLPQGIVEIGQFAFARSSLGGIAIPEGTRIIDYGAFYHCDQLTNVILPESIENVEPRAFAYTAWLKQFESSNQEFLISGNVLVAYHGMGTQVIIPDGVKVIAAEAFAGETKLEQVILPDSLEVIGEGAFENCTSLEDVSFGQNIRRIKDRAFAGCPLTEETLPTALEELGLKAFDEAVGLQYAGNAPRQTHEVSAERLSNEQYRNVTAESTQPGVTVIGMENTYAQLAGAARAYQLQITPTAEAGTVAGVQKAFERALGERVPGQNVVYELELEDNSHVPICKLGRQLLTLIMPVDEKLAGQNLKVVLMDRNGQLENVPYERILLEGRDCIRFSVSYISNVVIYGDGTPYVGEPIVEESISFQSMSAPPMNEAGGAMGPTTRYRVLVIAKWCMGGILMLGGFALLFVKKKKN